MPIADSEQAETPSPAMIDAGLAVLAGRGFPTAPRGLTRSLLEEIYREMRACEQEAASSAFP